MPLIENELKLSILEFKTEIELAIFEFDISSVKSLLDKED
jgi:hypothetical protein